MLCLKYIFLPAKWDNSEPWLREQHIRRKHNLIYLSLRTYGSELQQPVGCAQEQLRLPYTLWTAKGDRDTQALSCRAQLGSQKCFGHHLGGHFSGDICWANTWVTVENCDWYTSPPHSCPILPQKTHLGHGLASFSRGWADKAAKSLVPAAGCQAPVYGNAFPTLNGRKRWCVGNTQCCWSRGLWQCARPAWPSGGCSQKLSLEWISSSHFCCSPLCGNVRGVGWIPVLGLLWGLTWCMCLTSAPLAVHLWFYSLSFLKLLCKTEASPPWGLRVCVIQKYTSHHTSLGLLLLQPILALLGTFFLSSLCLIFSAREAFWKRAVPWAVS